MSTERDYYSILQVNRDASPEAVEKAYRRLAQTLDPATSTKPRAAARFREVSEAYATLSDRKKRADYDRQLARARTGGPAAGFGTPADVLSNRYVWLGAAGIIGAIILALVLVLLVGGGGEKAVVAHPTGSSAATAGTPTPVGQTPGATGPANPPVVSGQTVKTPSGLKYVDFQAGTGESPQAGQTVVVNYTGWLQADGVKFDSSLDSGQPFSFPLGQGDVIKGWDEGVATMKVGGHRRLVIPPDLAYGAQGFAPAIPPDATLIFDVELLNIEPVSRASP